MDSRRIAFGNDNKLLFVNENLKIAKCKGRIFLEYIIRVRVCKKLGLLKMGGVFLKAVCDIILRKHS